jgi:diamine N-acetyltransferase
MLRGKNIFLRALEQGDVELIYKWENQDDIFKISGQKEPLSKYILNKYINSITNLKNDGQLRLMICLNDRTPIGTVEMFEFDSYNLNAGVGVMIAEKKNRNNGYAEESLSLLINYGTDFLNLKQVYANITEDNFASLKLFEKLGFEKIGLKKCWVNDNGHWKGEWMLQKINE